MKSSPKEAKNALFAAGTDQFPYLKMGSLSNTPASRGILQEKEMLLLLKEIYVRGIKVK